MGWGRGGKEGGGKDWETIGLLVVVNDMHKSLLCRRGKNMGFLKEWRPFLPP